VLGKKQCHLLPLVCAVRVTFFGSVTRVADAGQKTSHKPINVTSPTHSRDVMVYFRAELLLSKNVTKEDTTNISMK
jgi:hypothetical protein